MYKINSEKNDKVITLLYKSTYINGWDSILHFAQSFCGYLKNITGIMYAEIIGDNLERVKLKPGKVSVFDLEELKEEHGVLSISGITVYDGTEFDIRILLYNQTDRVVLDILNSNKKAEAFSEDKEFIETLLTHLEIRSHSASSKISTIEFLNDYYNYIILNKPVDEKKKNECLKLAEYFKEMYNLDLLKEY